jgi:hypothetical protein
MVADWREERSNLAHDAEIIDDGMRVGSHRLKREFHALSSRADNSSGVAVSSPAGWLYCRRNTLLPLRRRMVSSHGKKSDLAGVYALRLDWLRIDQGLDERRILAGQDTAQIE